jgi:predicted metal-dependent hydrolase
MNKSINIVYYLGIGEVRYVHNPRARNITIRIKANGEVRVTVPRNVSQRKAEAFLITKGKWISRKLDQLSGSEKKWRSLQEGEILHVRGKEIPVKRPGGKGTVEDAIWKILLKEAKNWLPGRVEQLAADHGFKYGSVKIRKMQTRWGSCSPADNINLNSWLVMLPDHLSDYVILHELVHTRHRNHGKRFWELLDRHTGGKARQLRKELHQQRIMNLRVDSDAD